jgi:hypothetical protein
MLTTKSHSKKKNTNTAKQYSANPNIILENNSFKIDAFNMDYDDIKKDRVDDKKNQHRVFFVKSDALKYMKKNNVNADNLKPCLNNNYKIKNNKNILLRIKKEYTGLLKTRNQNTKINNVINNIKPLYLKDLKKIPLIENSKCASCKYKEMKYKKKNSKIHNIDNGTNWGALTGKFNNITVVDLDFYTKKDSVYDEKKCLFIKEFGKDYIQLFNTATVKTPRGGIHLYFIHDNEITTTTNKKVKIDIRSGGGYAVSPLSVINGVKYETIKDVSIKKLPDALKAFLKIHLYKKKNNGVKNEKNKTINNSDNATQLYKYYISFGEWFEIVHKLPSEYWTDYKKWLLFTTASKILGYRKHWNNVNKTKPKYNVVNNNVHWGAVNINYVFIIDEILKETDNALMINYYKYKPLVKDIIKPNKIINKNRLGYDFFDDMYNYVVKSDTGTGKTTSFKHYVKNYECNFISIVSRVTLGIMPTMFVLLRLRSEQDIIDIFYISLCQRLFNIFFSSFQPFCYYTKID